MKKFLMFLMFLLGMVVITNVHANILSYNPLTSDATVTYGFFNGGFTTIYNDYNGNIKTDNIANGTLLDVDFADSASPRVRTSENIGNYTYTGMLPVTSATLSSNISAGTSYVNGYRIVTTATAHTYTLTKDTWVYIDQNGAFQFSEVAVGAAEPTTPANSLLLAMATTNGTAITSVTDKRQTTPPGLRIYSFYKQGVAISRDATTATTINVMSGELEFGASVTNGKRSNTTIKNIDFTTTGLSGLDTGTLATSGQGYYFIWAVPSATTNSAFDVIASLSSTDAATVTNERLIGWCWANSTTSISPDSVGAYRGVGGDAPNIVHRKNDDTVTTALASWGAVPDLWTKFYSSGRPILVQWCVNNVGASTNTNPIFRLTLDGIPQKGSGMVNTTTNAVGDGWSRFNEASGVYLFHTGAGPHDINVEWKDAWGQTSTAISRDVVIIEQ